MNTLTQEIFNSFSFQSNYRIIITRISNQFSIRDKFSKTQDLKQIKYFVKSIMCWEDEIVEQKYLINKSSSL